MNYFRTTKLNLEKYLQVEPFRQAYAEELTRNPVIAAMSKCGEYTYAFYECANRRGPQDPECQERQMQVIACTTSVYAPAEFEQWMECEQRAAASSKTSDCLAEANAAVEKSSQEYERLMARPTHLRKITQSQYDRAVRECGFPGSNDPDSQENERIVECVAPIVCQDELAAFMQCVDKNGQDYGAAACNKSGLVFSKCFGAAMGDLAVLAEQLNSQE